MCGRIRRGVDLFLRRRRRLKYLFPMDDGESHVLLGFRVFFSCFGRRRRLLLLLLLLLLWYVCVWTSTPFFDSKFSKTTLKIIIIIIIIIIMLCTQTSIYIYLLTCFSLSLSLSRRRRRRRRTFFTPPPFRPIVVRSLDALGGAVSREIDGRGDGGFADVGKTWDGVDKRWE